MKKYDQVLKIRRSLVRKEVLYKSWKAREKPSTRRPILAVTVFPKLIVLSCQSLKIVRYSRMKCEIDISDEFPFAFESANW